MMNLYVRLQQALNQEKGATAVEYGLMVSLIAGVIVLAVTALGANVSATFNAVAAAII